MKKILAILLSVLMVVGLLAACGDDSGTASSKSTNSVALVENDDGTISLDVTYAEIGEASERKDVNVGSGKHVQSIGPKEETVYVEIGKTVKVEANILPTDAADPSLYYLSENENVAKVDKDGQVLGIEAGSTDIVMETNDRHFKTRTTVIVYRAVTDEEKVAAMIEKINAARKEANLAELKTDPILVAAATERAFEEAAEGDKKMDDERPTKNADGSAKTNAALLGIKNCDYSLWFNAKVCLYSWKTNADVDAMYNAFMENEDNKAKLLSDGDYENIGAGVFEHKGISYWCILMYK